MLVHKDTPVTSLEDLKGRKICMPEYGGIASVAFLNNLRANNLIEPKECNLVTLMDAHFGDSCIPGATDPYPGVPFGSGSEKLCSLCRQPAIPVGPAADPPVVNADVLPEDENPTGRMLQHDEEQAASDHLLLQDWTAEQMEMRNLRGSCDALITNRYFGNKGALRCLDEMGEVAVVELQYLIGE